MAKTAKKKTEVTVDLVITEPKMFVDFLKKFSSIDQSVLLELISNDDGQKIVIKSATASRTCVKIGEIGFDAIFKPSDELPETIKIGLYNFEKFIKVLVLSRDTNVNFKLTYDVNEKGECVAKNIVMINTTDEFEISILCAPQTIFANLTQDLERKVFDTSAAAFTFIMTRDFFGKFTSYIALDANDEFSLKIKNGKLYFNGKTQKLPFPDDVSIVSDDVEPSIKKEYLKYLDGEVYTVYAKNNVVIFESNDSDIKLALSASSDIPDDEDETDFDFDDDDNMFDDDEIPD